MGMPLLFPTIHDSFNCENSTFSNLRKFSLAKDSHYMECIVHWMFITDTLYEKKQTLMTYESESAQYQAQVEELEAQSAEKDTLVAKYDTMVKERKGQTNL